MSDLQLFLLITVFAIYLAFKIWKNELNNLTKVVEKSKDKEQSLKDVALENKLKLHILKYESSMERKREDLTVEQRKTKHTQNTNVKVNINLNINVGKPGLF